jgi:hypothetical protein
MLHRFEQGFSRIVRYRQQIAQRNIHSARHFLRGRAKQRGTQVSHCSTHPL